MQVLAPLAVEGDRDRLAALGVRAVAGDVAHLHDLEAHQRLVDLQRLRHHRAQRVGVGAVDDVEVLAVGEPGLRPAGYAGFGQRGRDVPGTSLLHDLFSLVLLPCQSGVRRSAKAVMPSRTSAEAIRPAISRRCAANASASGTPSAARTIFLTAASASGAFSAICSASCRATAAASPCGDDPVGDAELSGPFAGDRLAGQQQSPSPGGTGSAWAAGPLRHRPRSARA